VVFDMPDSAVSYDHTQCRVVVCGPSD